VRVQRTSVGLDVHALSVVACGFDEDTGGSVQKAAEARLRRGPCLATNARESGEGGVGGWWNRKRPVIASVPVRMPGGLDTVSVSVVETTAAAGPGLVRWDGVDRCSRRMAARTKPARYYAAAGRRRLRGASSRPPRQPPTPPQMGTVHHPLKTSGGCKGRCCARGRPDGAGPSPRSTTDSQFPIIWSTRHRW
jgi:hypothetical protein